MEFTGRPIGLNLHSTDFAFDCGRHLFAIAHQINQIGSPCFLRCSAQILAVIARKPHGREMLQISGLQYLSPGDSFPRNTLVLTDHQPHDNESVWLRVGRDAEPNLPVMPYPMHPATLRQLPSCDLKQLRSAPRNRMVFFAGNQKAKYGEGKIGRRFGICDRVEMLNVVREHFAASVTDQLLSDQIQTDQSTAPSVHPIALLDSRAAKIDAQQWLPILASANFFLCAPGSSQPTCHHLVEAMSVGTIPIIEYGGRMTPPLVDGETAITFTGVDGLVQAIQRALNMPAGQIAGMRTAAGNFYDHHWCQTQFFRQIRDAELDLADRKISLPFHHDNFYQSTATSNAA